jgi:hypothetical protein
MSNPIETITAARHHLVEHRRGATEALAKPYERGETERYWILLVVIDRALTMVVGARGAVGRKT